MDTFKKVALCFCVATVLVACGGGGGENPVVNEPKNTDSVPSGVSLENVIAYPADVQYVNLVESGITASKIISVNGLLDAKIKDGNISFATLGDTGSNIQGKIQFVDTNGKSYDLPITVASSRLLSAQPVTEKPEESEIESVVKDTLEIKGLIPGNFILGDGSAISFALVNAPKIDSIKSKIVIDGTDGTTSTEFDAKSYFKWDSTTSTYSVSGNDLNGLYEKLPYYPVTLTFSFLSLDREYARIYEMTIQRASAKLKGTLVNSAGAALTSLAGKTVDIVGFNTGVRKVAAVNADGSFTIDKLPTDTYEISVVDLDNPKTVIGTVFISKTDTNVNFNLDATLLLPTGITVESGTLLYGTHFHGNGVKPIPRDKSSVKKSYPIGLESTCSPSEGSFTVTAANAGAAQTCVINYMVPKGTKSVEVLTTVTTEEYPEYTQELSEFNDTWSYAVNGIPSNVIRASGEVNTTHYSKGTISTKKCYDVSSATKNADLKISGSLVTTNIGDSDLPTTVSAAFKNSCSDVKITKAVFGSPNSKGYQVVNAPKPIAGYYLSVPISSAAIAWGIPLQVEFSPKDAEITHVNVMATQGGKELPLGNFFDKAIISQEKIAIKDFIMPKTNLNVAEGVIQISVELKGKLKGTTFSTDAELIKFGSQDKYTPLFLAGDNSSLSTRRYGIRDAGGDSWARASTINWLLSKTYRFNDITGLHAPQNPTTGRSILNHTGHSDGKQIDMRYSDGAGGYSEDLGGAGLGAKISELANKAKAEVDKINAATTPEEKEAVAKTNLVKLQDWIIANRNMITSESNSGSVRKIHIGNSFIYKILVEGKFPSDSTSILGVEAWSLPLNVSVADDHLDHWHVSLK